MIHLLRCASRRITVKWSASYTRAMLNGREHYVVPVTMIFLGGLSGSRGALCCSPEEFAAVYAAWVGMHLCVYHPIRNGNPVSARSSEVLNSQGIGVVRKSRITPKGKLVAEGWFDIEKTERVDRRVLYALQRGDQIELSTGLYTDTVPVRNGSQHIGKPYTHVAKNFRPDHLAILPDQLGACSIKDGCGVGVANSRPQGHSLIPPQMVW